MVKTIEDVNSMSKEEFDLFMDSITDEDLNSLLQPKIKTVESVTDDPIKIENISKQKVKSETKTHPQLKSKFNLQGKTLLNSDIMPFQYTNVPYDILFKNMIRDVSAMYLKYVLIFLIVLLLVIIILH